MDITRSVPVYTPRQLGVRFFLGLLDLDCFQLEIKHRPRDIWGMQVLFRYSNDGEAQRG